MQIQGHQAAIPLLSVLENASIEEQQVLFLPTGIHPEWEDQQEIFELAISQIQEPVKALVNAIPLAFIGVHSLTKFTGKRDSVGFLLTDYGALVQTDVSVIGKPEQASVFKFTTTQKSGQVSDALWELFTGKLSLDIPQEQKSAMQAVLYKVLQTVLPMLQQSGHLPSEVKTAAVLTERIKELGLQSVFRFPNDNEKLFAKVAAKFGITSTIRCGVIDKPLIGGAYGLVITHEGLSSRDLMEEPEHTAWSIVKEIPAAPASESDAIMIDKQKHVFPKHQAGSRSALIVLINELAQGKVN